MTGSRPGEGFSDPVDVLALMLKVTKERSYVQVLTGDVLHQVHRVEQVPLGVDVLRRPLPHREVVASLDVIPP